MSYQKNIGSFLEHNLVLEFNRFHGKKARLAIVSIFQSLSEKKKLKTIDAAFPDYVFYKFIEIQRLLKSFEELE